MRPEEARRARGWALQFLAMSEVGADGLRRVMSSKLLARMFEGAQLSYTTQEVERVLAYLADKGYVRTERMHGAAAEIQPHLLARITAAGQDLVEQTSRDPGIDLGAL